MFYFGKTKDPELIMCKGPSTNTEDSLQPLEKIRVGHLYEVIKIVDFNLQYNVEIPSS